MQGNFDNVWLVILEKLRSIFDQLCLVRPEIQILSWLMYNAVYKSSPELFTQVYKESTETYLSWIFISSHNKVDSLQV